MPNITDSNVELDAGESFTIELGYHNGATISATSLSDQTMADAEVWDILSGKTAWVNGIKITGTMTNNPAISIALPAGESYTIPIGYHDGSSVIYAEDLESQTPGSATATEILSNYSAWVNGEKIIGTMPVNPFVEEVLLAGESYTIPYGYHDRSSTIEAADLASQTVSDAVDNEIFAGKTAWVNGVKVTGTMPYIGAVNEVVACSEVYNIPEGYHSGSGKVTGKDLASQTVADAQAKNILTGKTAWVNGTKVTGTMVYNEAEDVEIAPGTNYIIPQGYHTGAGWVWTKSIADQTVGTATAEDMLEGSTAWVNGEEVTGTIPIITGQSITLDGGDQYIIPAGYYDGTSVVIATGVDDQTPGTATADDIIKDKTAWVNGIKITGNIELTGNAISVQVLKGKTFYNTNVHQQITGELELTGDAEEAYVLKGYKFYSNDPFTQLEGTLELTGDARTAHVLAGETFYTTHADFKETGTMINRGAIVKGLVSGEVYTIPAGYHNGNGRVTAPSIESVTEGTAVASDILAPKTAWVAGEKLDRKSTRLNSSHIATSRMPSSA